MTHRVYKTLEQATGKAVKGGDTVFIEQDNSTYVVAASAAFMAFNIASPLITASGGGGGGGGVDPATINAAVAAQATLQTTIDDAQDTIAATNTAAAAAATATAAANATDNTAQAASIAALEAAAHPPATLTSNAGAAPTIDPATQVINIPPSSADTKLTAAVIDAAHLLTLTLSDATTVPVDLSALALDTKLASAAMNANNLELTMSDASTLTVDLSQFADDVKLASAALNGNNLEFTLSDASVVSVDATSMLADIRTSSMALVGDAVQLTLSDTSVLSQSLGALLGESADANNLLTLGTDNLLHLPLDPSGFSGNLAPTDNTLQAIADKVDAMAAVIPETDTTAPDPIANLTASTGSAGTDGEVELTWTATGDDGNTGQATTYDIRYSTNPITEAQWDSLTQASGEPAPQPVSSVEGMTLTGLTPGTLYYVGIKAIDEEGNTGTLSNITQATSSVAAAGGAVRVNYSSTSSVAKAVLQGVYDNNIGGTPGPDTVPAAVSTLALAEGISGWVLYLGHTNWWYSNNSGASWTSFGSGGKANFSAAVATVYMFV